MVLRLVSAPGVKLVGVLWRDREGRHWLVEEPSPGLALVLNEVALDAAGSPFVPDSLARLR